MMYTVSDYECLIVKRNFLRALKEAPGTARYYRLKSWVTIMKKCGWIQFPVEHFPVSACTEH